MNQIPTDEKVRSMIDIGRSMPENLKTRLRVLVRAGMAPEAIDLTTHYLQKQGHSTTMPVSACQAALGSLVKIHEW